MCIPSKGQAAVNVAKCAQAEGCDKAKYSPLVLYSNPQDCIEKFCKKEEQACENDRRCIQVLNFCDDRCNTSLTCWRDCVDRSKDTNASNYFTCIIKNSCLNSTKATALAVYTPIECIQQQCSAQWDACRKDRQCVTVLQDC